MSFRFCRGRALPMALTFYLVTVFLAPVPLPAQRSGDASSGAAAENDIAAPWVVVIVPETEEGDPRTETVALVVADTIEMTLRLIGEYAVQPRPEGEAAPGATEVAAYAERERMDYVVFGEVSADAESETRFSLSVYSREADAVTLEREAVARSLFDTFSVADELSAELLGAFTGQRIAYGRVELRNEADLPGTYRVYIDGSPAGTSVTMLDRVLVGEREVAVEALQGPQAGTIITRQQLTVTEGGFARITFVAEGVPEPEPKQQPDPLAPVEPPPAAIPPVAVSPPPSDAAPDEAAVVEEPEIPLEWRVYPWRRWERERELIWTAAAHLGIEDIRNRDGGDTTTASLSRFQLHWDLGPRHRLLLGRESVDRRYNDEHTNHFNSPDLLTEDLTYGYVERTQRIYAWYGRRFAPLSFMHFVPAVRLGVEQEARLVSYVDETGSTIPLPQNPGSSSVQDDLTGALFWNLAPAAEIATEFYLRRFSLQFTLGTLGVIPIGLDGTDYEVTINSFDRETDEPLSFVVAGSRAASFSWYALIGAGYSWGGNEARINATSPQREPARVYPPTQRRRWGVALLPSVTMGRLLAPGYGGSLFSMGVGTGLSLQVTHASGYLLGLGASTATIGDRYVSRLYQTETDPTVRTNEGIDAGDGDRFPVVALGRRLSLRPSLFLRLEYRIARHQAFIELGEVDGATDIEEMEYVQAGPHIALEHALPGSGALVFGGLQLYNPLPTGSTRYSEGEAVYWFGEALSFTPDGYSFMVSELTAEFGISFRLAGTPQRMLAAEGRDDEWVRYSREGIGAEEEPTTGASESVTRDEARWWVPRVSTGLGVEYIIADGEFSDRYGATMILPMALRFPFGLEFGVQSSLPLGSRGVSSALDERRVTEVIEPGTGERLEAEGRLNRIFAIDLGYRFRRNHRLSFRPGVRYVLLDDELWNIRTIREDGTILATDEGRFAHAGVKALSGFAADVSYALSDRIVLRAVGSLLPISRYQEVDVSPALAPTVTHRLTNALGSFGILLTVEW
ncbi:MAG: hypothetical protein R6U25_08705 [Alkalispirochaeta sp.]